MSNPSSSDPVSDEILSAYIDGELSPAEVVAVERWLKSSPDVRNKLADFQRLSGLLQDLSQEVLPEEFASQVMAQAERRMLLPVNRRMSVPSIARRVRFWAVSVGLPVTAACLLVAIQWDRPKNAQRFAEPLPDPAPKLAAAREATSSNGLAPERSGDAQKSPPEPLIADSESGNRLVLPKRQDESPSAEATPEEALNGVESLVENQTAGNGQFPGKTSISTVLNHIKEFNESGKIPVVRIFVVDRQDGLEVLQVMLEGQKIIRDDSTAHEQQETASDKRALFVVASAKELMSALKALEARSDAIESWKLSEPVDLARFDQSSQTRMSEVMAFVAGARPEPPTGMAVGAAAAIGTPSDREVANAADPTRKPATHEASPRKGASGRRSSSPGRSTSPDRDGGGLADVPFTRPGRRSVASSGRQVLVTMDDSGRSSQAGQATPGSSATRTPETGRGGLGAPSAKGTETPETDGGIRGPAFDRQPPVRVVFVIERRPSPPAEVPPARESPGGGAA